MKLSFAQITPFLAAPPKDIRVILVYGPDAGLVHERAELLAQKLVPDHHDPFAVTSFSGSALGGDAAKLMDEMASIPLTGGKKLVRVHQASESNAGPLDAFLKDPVGGEGSVLLIEAEELPPRSKLRSLCEGKSPIATAVPCYLEDAAARARTISEILATEKLSAPRDVVLLLTSCLPPDRMAMRSEMEKLALYAKGQSTLTVEDVRAVIAQAGGAEIDDLVAAIAEGKSEDVLSLFDFLIAEQTSPVTLLRAAQRHFTRLHLARGFMDQGLSAKEALQKLSPPVFWKNVDPMIRQLNRWPTPRLEQRLAELLSAEAASKRTGTPDTALCAQLFLSLAAKG
jgi:DNA polymerase-3 subunit delta